MKRYEVYQILDGERAYQETKASKAEDESHSLGDFMIFMEHHLKKAKEYWSTWQSEKAHHEMRKVTALGIACFEAHGVPERVQSQEQNQPEHGN